MLSTTRFLQWFPQYAHILKPILHENCSAEFAAYRSFNNTNRHGAVVDNAGCASASIASGKTCPVTSRQLDMQAANVLLGLTPTLLSMLGSDLTELALLSQRRPLFALLLVLGSPTISPIRLFQRTSPQTIIQTDKASTTSPLWLKTGPTSISIVLLQYAVALGSIANVGLLAHDFSTRTILLFGCNAAFHPYIWTFAAVIIYALNIAAFPRGITMPQASWRKWYRNEFMLSHLNDRTSIKWEPQTPLYSLLMAVASVGIVLHLAYGTFVLSGSAFVGSVDAITALARLLISTVACRAVLMFELAGLRVSKPKDDGRPLLRESEPGVPLEELAASGPVERRTI